MIATVIKERNTPGFVSASHLQTSALRGRGRLEDNLGMTKWGSFPHLDLIPAVLCRCQWVSGVPVSQGVPELCRCGTWGHGVWAWWDGLGLDLGNGQVFSSLHNSLIL